MSTTDEEKIEIIADYLKWRAGVDSLMTQDESFPKYLEHLEFREWKKWKEAQVAEES